MIPAREPPLCSPDLLISRSNCTIGVKRTICFLSVTNQRIISKRSRLRTFRSQKSSITHVQTAVLVFHESIYYLPGLLLFLYIVTCIYQISCTLRKQNKYQKRSRSKISCIMSHNILYHEIIAWDGLIK